MASHIEGLDEELSRLNGAGDAALAITMRCIDEVDMAIERDAKQISPVDTGNMVAQTAAIPAKRQGSSVKGEVIVNTPYALAVHEGPPEEVSHAQGQWKFLEIPFRRLGPKLPGIIREDMNKAGL